MALTQEQKLMIAQQLAEKRAVMGDTGFQQYMGKLEAAIPQVAERRNQELTNSIAEVPRTKGILGFLNRVTGTEGLGRGIAAMINTPGEARRRDAMLSEQDSTRNSLITAIRDARTQGKDTSRLERALQDFEGTTGAINEGMRQRADLGVTNREVIGSALRTAGTIAGAGSFGGGTTGRLSTVAAPQLTTATTIGQGAVQGSLRGLATGARSGAILGGVSGVATGIEQEKGVLGTAFEAAKQATFGGVVGGVAGAVAGGVGGGLQARANRKQELATLLSGSDNVDEALSKAKPGMTLDLSNSTISDDVASTAERSRRTAGFDVVNGKVVKNPKAQALLKQGIDDKSVVVMQSFSPEDTKAAREMVKIAKEVSDTGIATQRQQEIVGQTFMRRVKDVETLNRTAGSKIDDIARTQLAGQEIQFGSAVDDFVNNLERAGVDVDALRAAQTQDDIAQAFAGSDFEGINTAQKTFKTVLNRVDGLNDGLAGHRVKRFIDNQVTYGKNAEGLTGDAERLLKGLRSGIDEVLDTASPDYNLANTQYKDTIEALDEMRRLIGKDYLGSKDIANLRAGEVMNRLLGNASAKPLSSVQALENVAKKYGLNYNDSIIKQITFADLLDDVYQTTPTRGFQGGVQRGVEGAATDFLSRMRQGGFVSATIDTAAEKVQAARGITPESAQQAIEAFLNLSGK